MFMGNNKSKKIITTIMVVIILITRVGGTVIAGLSSLF